MVRLSAPHTEIRKGNIGSSNYLKSFLMMKIIFSKGMFQDIGSSNYLKSFLMMKIIFSEGMFQDHAWGATLAQLDQSKTSLIMIGGLSIPKPDKQKFHPTDSNIFILNLSEKKWIKLDQME